MASEEERYEDAARLRDEAAALRKELTGSALAVPGAKKEKKVGAVERCIDVDVYWRSREPRRRTRLALCVCVCVFVKCVCVLAHMRVCVLAHMRACVRACVRAHTGGVYA